MAIIEIIILLQLKWRMYTKEDCKSANDAFEKNKKNKYDSKE